jgi:hypothetical protein
MPDTPTPAVSRASASVRARFAEALARRASAHAGAARRLLDARLAALMDKLPGASEATAERAVQRSRPGPLAELVAQAARQKSMPVLAPATTPRDATTDKAASGPAADPKTLQFFKQTWSRLSAEQRLAQSRASLPENAGPLNSQHLVHRSLTLMQALSPGYLERFVAYIDALQWVEHANEAAAQEAAAVARPCAGRKSMAARR